MGNQPASGIQHETKREHEDDHDRRAAERRAQEVEEAAALRARHQAAAARVERGERGRGEQRVDHAHHAREARIPQAEEQRPPPELLRPVPRGVGRLALVGHRLLGRQRPQLEPVRQRVRRREVGTAPACGDAIGSVAIDGLVAAVVMKITGQRGRQPGAARSDVLLLEVGEVAPRGGLGDVVLGAPPARLGRDQQDLVAGSQALAGLGEVVELTRVEVGVELDVDRPQPPPVREPEREVAAALARAPAADPALAAEHPQEAREAVVPVVVARNGAQVGSGLLVLAPQRGGEGPEEVVLVGLDRRRRIHLVAAEDQQLAARQDRRRLHRRAAAGPAARPSCRSSESRPRCRRGNRATAPARSE